MNKVHQKVIKGFTLVELLIVIAVLGILAAAVLSAIDPVDKINSGNDAKVISDVTTIVKAAQAFSVNNAAAPGTYPLSLTVIAFNNELTSVPTPPNGHGLAYTYTVPAGGGTLTVAGIVKSRKDRAAASAAATDTAYYKYTSVSGKSCFSISPATACP